MPQPLSPVLCCPECGAPLAAGQSRCWLCERTVSAAAADNPYAPPRPIAGQYVAGQFSLATLFLITTLVAVCLGVFMLSPGFGILLVVFATPAMVRTVIANYRQKEAGVAPSIVQKVEAFMVSLFIMMGIALAAFIAFEAVCWAGALATMRPNASFPNAGVGVVVGLLVAIPLMIWLLWISRPARAAPRTDAK